MTLRCRKSGFTSDEQRHAWCFYGGAKHGTEIPFKDHADFVTVALFLKEQAGGRVQVRPAL